MAHSDLEPQWEATDEIVEEFRQFLHHEETEFDEADFTANTDYIKRMIKREVYVSAYDLDEGERIKHTLDPDVQQAVALLPKAAEMLKAKDRVIAQR